jgi:hypothetical protein
VKEPNIIEAHDNLIEDVTHWPALTWIEHSATDPTTFPTRSMEFSEWRNRRLRLPAKLSCALRRTRVPVCSSPRPRRGMLLSQEHLNGR